MSPTRPVTAISSTSNFQLIFSTALKAYERRTKTDILTHPLASRLQACNSPSSILAVLQDQVEDFAQARSSDESLTKWLNPTINVLLAFSATLGDGVSLVRFSLVISSCDYAFTASIQVFSPATVIFAGAGVLLQVCIFFEVSLQPSFDQKHPRRLRMLVQPKRPSSTFLSALRISSNASKPIPKFHQQRR